MYGTFGDWGYLYPNDKTPYKIGFTQQTIITKACGYDLFPVQQLEFARLKFQKLKEFKRINNYLKRDTFKYTLKKKKRLFSFLVINFCNFGIRYNFYTTWQWEK